MGKKRESPEGESPGPGAKKAKSPEEEFTGTRFRALLREPHLAMTGLEKFLSLARRLPSPNLHDVVEGYIKISIECIEILKLLDGENRAESEIMLIFQTLEAILLRTASDLSHLSVAGVNIVKKILNAHMKLIYASMYSKTHRLSRICLNLLSAMVTQGPDCARDVFSHFDFNNKFLPGLLKRRDKQGRPDVRMAYIQFALSFFISGDNTVIVQVLELKDFVGEIFNTGIKEDRISTINILLTLLQTKVIQNKAITKTQKVRFFTSANLNHIASLYRWNGIVDVSTKGIQVASDPKEAGKSMVRELVHSFLLDICCSLKHGINFYDPSLGTAARAGNLVLLQFLVGLKSAAEDELVGELVVNILKVCPDLLSRYFKETQYSFVPRLKTAWLDNMKLLKKIYEAQSPVSVAFQTTEFVPVSRLINMVMITTVAPVCNKGMLTQGLNTPNKIVKQTILSLMASILKRAEVNIRHCLKEEIWQKSDLYTPAAMAEFAEKYQEALGKLLPDINTIVATWQALLKPEEEAGGKKAEDGPAPEEKQATSSGDIPTLTGKEDDLQTTLVKSSLLQVLCLYQRVVPHLVSQSNFDFSKLLKGIVTEGGIREEVPPVLQHQILQVALELPANKFSWFKGQEASDEGGEKSVFYLFLKMFVTCNKTTLKTSTRQLIIKILRDSGVFDYTWRELEIWLRCLDKVEEASQETVIQLLEQALVKLVSDPYPYTDKAAEYVQEASALQISLGKPDSDSVSIPVSHIDDVIDMVDVIMEGGKDLDEEVGFALDEEMILQTFPFSPVVPVALEARNRILTSQGDGCECIVQYLISVLTDILHTQRNPLALCLILQSYDKDLQYTDGKSIGYAWLQNFWSYYSLWLPPSATESLFPSKKAPATDGIEAEEALSYSFLLKRVFVDGDIDGNSRHSLKDSISQMALEELPLATQHTLLCLKTTVDDFHKYKKSTGSELISLYLERLVLLLCQYRKIEDDQKEMKEELKEDSELFTEGDNIQESPGNMILDLLLTAALKHPILEGWFLALERQSVPPHSLNPVTVRLLSSAMNQGLTRLLEASAPLLQRAGNIHLLEKYFEAISVSVLRELEVCKKTPSKFSNQLEALQRLHLYMDTVQLNEVILAILKLPEEFLFVASAESTQQQLSVYGKVLVELLSDGHLQKQWQDNLSFSVEHVRGVGHLLTSSMGADLEPVLLDALQREPAFAHVVGVDVLTYCLDKMSPESLQVAALLLQHNATHRLQFELWCLKPGTEKLLRKKMEVFVPLVNEYLKSREHSRFIQISKVSSAVLDVLKEAFWKKLVKEALSTEFSEEPNGQIVLLSRLVTLSETNDLTKLLDELPDTLAQTCSTERWALADSVSRAAERAGVAVCSWRRALLASSMKCLTATYGANKDREQAAQEVEKAVLSRLQNLMALVKEDVPKEWNNLVKAGLKYRYQDTAFLDALCSGIDQWYEQEGPCTEGLLSLSVIHMMITQHSLFLPNFLRSREEEESSVSDIRERLVDLLRAIVRKCPSVCDKKHFAVLLGAYGGTLSVTDQKLLSLLQAYEQNNLSLIDFRLLLWGPAAVEHHKTRKSLGQSLWQQPSMEEILTLLDRERMQETILHFPLHRKLTVEAGKNVLHEDRTLGDLSRLYDPCFLLPLFSELLRPELAVDCEKFVEVNALGLTLVALSSYNPTMRAAANYVLGSFLSHMEGARFRGQMQVQYLLDVVKNSVRQENVQFTFPLALYAARAVQLLLKPEEHMYMKISRFLLSHEYLDMKKVPDFYRLFYSSFVEHKMEREWILSLLSDGMRDKHCYTLYEYQRINMVIMAFYNTPLCDETSQNQILEILTKASKVTKAAYELLRDHSLLTWIQNILEKRYVENKTLGSVITLVNNLWFTNLGKKDQNMARDSQEEGKAEQGKFLPIHMVNEFFGVAMLLLRHIRPNLDNTHLSQYFCTLSSVLRYRAQVLKAFKKMGRFAVNEQVLSMTHVLLLLHKWSVITKDLDLQERLTSIAKEHRIKELTSTIKEKFRQPGPRRLRKRNDAEDEAAPAPQDPLQLEDAKNHVKSILIHWKPSLLNQPEERAQGTDQLKEDPMETGDLEKSVATGNGVVCATACLAAKWVIQVEKETAYKSQDLYNTVLWLQTSILPHRPVVCELLTDGVWRSSLYKLYCNATADGPESPLTLLFNQVMMELLEAQNLLTDSYRALGPLLSLDDTTDRSKKAASSFLASLYIGDMWLGAAPPLMFDTHVKMVCQAADMDAAGSKEKTPRKKRKENLEAMVSLCRGVSSTLSNS